jgi:putative two-component system protein, hydrogenase maturation factor HypX/HoxX
VRILLVASAFNSLTQRVFAELGDRGHRVGVEVAVSPEALCEAVDRDAPDLIVAPMLTTAVPRQVHAEHPCLIVHPGPPGDRGPSSLDHAVLDAESRWGVTVLQAEEEMDAGPVWAWAPCDLPPAGKSDLYRGEIADAALEAVTLAVERYASGTWTPTPQSAADIRTRVRTRPVVRQSARRIDWAADSTETVLRKLRSADSRPGVLDELLGTEWFLHGGHREERLRGDPGTLVTTHAEAVCRATVDGAVWIPQLRRRRSPGGPRTFALPATLALGPDLPHLPDLPDLRPEEPQAASWSDITYHEDGPVGYLRFTFTGGAMSTRRCRRLLAAYRAACGRPTSVLVLGGARDFFSNGIHLGVIEAAADPAAESWENLLAMDDLVEAVLTTADRLVVAAVAGNAAAGGAMLAMAADEVWCRHGAVLNPHYRLMGLYGSEFWTYTLPRRAGERTAERLARQALPVSAGTAHRMGLVDHVIRCAPGDFTGHVRRLAARTAHAAHTQARIAGKKAALEQQEAHRPLAGYREAELDRMHRTFFDPDHPYHALRAAFVYKSPADRTPEHLRGLLRAQP